jgi:hypothetical protein
MKTETTLIRIKELKDLNMYYEIETKGIWLGSPEDKFFIPKNKIFPVLRGLISATQRFYRKKK